ncbi:AlbA family DNA-binding domain-containing protein [Anabaena sp. WFMT]|uniref:AlbA family DNA-binding domain-containing protein n=1 Tax=Anabaena sp. WFMT TaxID=3449730 RepID=UPI003F23FC21
MTTEKRKGLKEAFAVFFENPSRESLRQLLIDHTGEHDDLDFKSEFELIAPQILAKHIIAMANKSGGVIIFGVKETENGKFESVGLQLDDKTEFSKKIEAYLPDKLIRSVHDVSFNEAEYTKIIGKSFRVVIVEYTPEYIPFLSKKDGEGIKKNLIYIRKNSSSETADYNDLQDIFNRRLETSFSSAREISLTEHFKELKEIYSLLSKNIITTKDIYSFMDTMRILSMSGITESKPNPKYPEEDYDDFVVRMLTLKKSVIESIIKSDKFFR